MISEDFARLLRVLRLITDDELPRLQRGLARRNLRAAALALFD